MQLWKNSSLKIHSKPVASHSLYAATIGLVTGTTLGFLKLIQFCCFFLLFFLHFGSMCDVVLCLFLGFLGCLEGEGG